MIRAVIFDLDQTLIDRSATFTTFLERQYQGFENDMLGIPRDSFISLALDLDNNGYTPKEDLYTKITKHFSLTIHNELLADFKEHYGHEPNLFPNVIRTLRQLKAKYKLGLITNGRSRGQRAKIHHSGLEAFFDSIKISEEEGVAKPNPIIFERCLEDLGISAYQAVYVGDHPENDILAAEQVGLKTIWVSSSYYQDPKANATIESVSELLRVFEQRPFENF